MKAVVQRVSSASVCVDGSCVGTISAGLLVYLGVMKGDATTHADRLAMKVAKLRVFPDAERNMNRSVVDVSGGVMVISQFTLAARTERGNRPSFSDAETGPPAESLYQYFVEKLRAYCPEVQTGIFGAMMRVESVNDGPVTIPIEVSV